MFIQAFQDVIGWYMGNINYATITALMAVESSFIPFPSEVVVPPAAWKAAQGERDLFLVVLFATLGALIGALVNYFLALSLGRTLIHRLASARCANMLLIDCAAVEKSEAFFLRYGRSSTLIGRLVPAVRQLISLPAGLARMNLRDFLLYTAVGAGIWNAILAALGYFLYSQKELLAQYYDLLTVAGLVLGAGMAAFLAFRFLRRGNRTISS